MKTRRLTQFLAIALASLGLSSSRAGFDVGVDFNLGADGIAVASPNGGGQVNVSGYTGTGRSGPATDYTLDVPKDKTFYSGLIGITPFVGYTSEDESIAKDFKIGIELGSRWNLSPATREGDNTYFYASKTDNGWGEWPNAAVIAEIKRSNLIFLEKPFMGYKEKDIDGGFKEQARLSLIARLDEINIKNKATTASVPYGGGWYGSYQSTITSSRDLGEKNVIVPSLGIRGSFEGKVSNWFNLGGFLEVSCGLPVGDVKVMPSLRCGAIYKF